MNPFKFLDIQHRRAVADESQRPFDLEQWPLLRATLLRLAPRDHVLVFVRHHVVADGWSTGVLLEEIRRLYEAYAAGAGEPLPELPIQYTDFADWQREWLRGDVLEQQLGYWRDRLTGVEPLELPTDRVRPAMPSYAADSCVRMRARSKSMARMCTGSRPLSCMR